MTFADHPDKSRVIIGTTCAPHGDAVIFSDFLGLDVEVIEHLYMIANKADGRDDDFFAACGGQLSNGIADVGFEPRIGGLATAALIGD